MHVPNVPMTARKRTPEGGVLHATLQALAVHPRVAWAQRMNSGAAMIKGYAVRFGFVGCSDVIGQLRDGRFLAVECKATRGELTEPQRLFLELVRANGGVAGMVRSVDDLFALLA